MIGSSIGAQTFLSGVMQGIIEAQSCKEYWANKMYRCKNRNKKRKKNMLNVSKLKRKNRR